MKIIYFLSKQQYFLKCGRVLETKVHSFRKTEYNQGDYVEQQTPAYDGDHAKPNREMSKSPALKTKAFYYLKFQSFIRKKAKLL